MNKRTDTASSRNMAQLSLENRRLSHQKGELIDREMPLTFTFNGRSIQAFKGDTIGSALMANGVDILGRSFKYHRPRGLMAFGHSISAMVQIGKEVSESAWLRAAEEGLDVKSVNVWPSLERDLMSLTQAGAKLMPVGFYYKTFMRPAFMWPTYEKVLRRAAGLGKVDINAPLEKGFIKQYLHADVVVVGGGPAGLSAASMAAAANARVILFDENLTLGGHVRFNGRPATKANLIDPLIKSLETQPQVTIKTNTTVLGRFDDNWLFAVQGKVLFKIRARAIVFATGATNQPLLFDNNDLPGIMMAQDVQRLLHLYRVVPGQRAVIITANDDGWQVAADLYAAGVTIMGVADLRPNGHTEVAEQLSHLGIPAFWRHTAVSAHGKNGINAISIAPVDTNGRFQPQTVKQLACDFLPVSMAWAPDNGLLYQAGADIRFDDSRNEFLAKSLPPTIFAAGRINGTHSLENEVAEGKLAGQQAAAYCGFGTAVSPQQKAALSRKKKKEPLRTSILVRVESKGKQFVDFDEDVTFTDLKTAIAEGYSSIELLKRYSTISMGPSQGKTSSINSIHLTARENQWTPGQTGTTTSRPPYRPVKLGALGGQLLEPTRRTPLHHWHLDQGAKMMVAGLWLRPEHYGDPIAEVNAVRQRVGLIDVSTLGKIKLTGEGVPDLLDKIYVNKWQKLAVGRVRYGLMCNDEGIIMDDGVTAKIGPQEWYSTTTSSGASTIFEWIQWWIQSGWGKDVHATNVSEGWAAFNLAGPKSRATLAQLTSADLTNEAFPYMAVRDIEIAAVSCRVMRIGFTGELSYEIHCPASQAQTVWQALIEAGTPDEIRPFGVEAQRILRLEKSHIIVGHDTDALTDPISANQAWAVKLDKKTFLGQRPLSRIAQSGPTQRLVGFKMRTPDIVPEEGLQIVQPDQSAPIGLGIIGWVTSSRFSPTINQTIGLCWLPVDLASQNGAVFTIRRQKKLLEAQVFHGAFYDPKGERLRGL